MTVSELVKFVGAGVAILGALVAFVVMAVKCWSMEHNIPDLWKQIDSMRERINSLERRMTKEIAVLEERQRGEHPDG